MNSIKHSSYNPLKEKNYLFYTIHSFNKGSLKGNKNGSKLM